MSGRRGETALEIHALLAQEASRSGRRGTMSYYIYVTKLMERRGRFSMVLDLSFSKSPIIGSGLSWRYLSTLISGSLFFNNILADILPKSTLWKVECDWGKDADKGIGVEYIGLMFTQIGLLLWRTALVCRI
jgi:hypothetical protein